MIERCEQLRFTFEAGEAIGIKRKRFGQELQRDIAPQLRIPCAIDLAHTADPERPDNLIVSDTRTAR